MRIDKQARVVEFDGLISPLLHSADPAEADGFFIEAVVCTPDTKAHESLVVTSVDARHVHAALLVVGLEPGEPGNWAAMEGGGVERIAPSGDAVEVRIVVDGKAVRPGEWIIDLRTRERWGAREWVFAGSVEKELGGRTIYLGGNEGNGTVVGFTTFGTEVIAPVEVISHSSAVDEPVWIADTSVVPANGTPVVVRITPAD